MYNMLIKPISLKTAVAFYHAALVNLSIRVTLMLTRIKQHNLDVPITEARKKLKTIFVTMDM